MKDTFDLKKFLVENKITTASKLLKEDLEVNGKKVSPGSIEVAGVDSRDYPDFSDAYIIYAEFEDGEPLSEEEMIKFEEDYPEVVNELAYDSLIP